MKKNVGSQVVVAQLVSKTDGSAVTTGTTSVYVLGDGGAQFLGSPGPATATHEGNGVWSYVPEQGETNFDHIAFTFVNSSAVNATIQVYTSYPQTGDNYARLGAPAGASVSADVAAVKAETATILSDTNDIQTRIPASLVSGRIDASVGAMAAAVVTAAAIATDAIDADAIAADAVTEIQSGLATAATLSTVAGYLDTEIAAILADTNELQTDWANGGRLDLILDARASQTSVDDLPTNAELATALGTADDAVLAQVALVKAVTDKVDTTMESVGSPGQYVFTADALAQAPSGTGASATAIADEVQTRTIAAVTVVNGLAANTVTAAALATDAVTEIQSGLATAADLATVATYVDTEVAAIKAKTDNLPASPASAADVAAVLTSTLTEGYAADGAALTVEKALHMIWALLAERSIAATTLTAKKLDGSTTAMTFTLDSATTPTSQTRAT